MTAHGSIFMLQLLLIGSTMFAQEKMSVECLVSVVDSFGDPLPAVTVKMRDTLRTNSVLTDVLGVAKFRCGPGPYELKLERFGFQTVSHSMSATLRQRLRLALVAVEIGGSDTFAPAVVRIPSISSASKAESWVKVIQTFTNEIDEGPLVNSKVELSGRLVGPCTVLVYQGKRLLFARQIYLTSTDREVTLTR